ncbi:MAG TPA: hypothetical protein VIX12_04125, partial [Candidatus Binataceae bacterium]
MTSEHSDQKRLERALFLIPFVTFAYFYQGADQSTAARFDLIRSILERRTLWIDGYAGFNTADIINFKGHIYSVKAPGTSLTALVPWAWITTILRPLGTNHEPMFWALATYLTIVCSTGLLVAWMAVLMFRFALAMGASVGRAAGLAIVLSFATIVFPYATELTGEPIAAACAFAAFYLLATFDNRAGPARALGSGFLAGLAVLNDYPTILIAGAIGIYAVFKLTRWSHAAAFSLGAAIT